MDDLKKIANFLQTKIEENNNDEMFSVIFPLICIRLNKTKEEELEEIFNCFLGWWNKNSDFINISNDVEIVLKFEEYYKGIYQLVKRRNEVTKQWIANGILNPDGTIADEYKPTQEQINFFKNL